VTCAEIDVLLAEYVEGGLRGAPKAAVEEHLAVCASCAELARDSAEAIALMERAETVEAPPELVTRILYEVTSGPSRAAIKPSWVRRVFGKRLEQVLQPRYAMGMAMTLLSFAMMGRFAGIRVRNLTPSDLDPVKVWMAAEDRVMRTWDRGVKYYQSLRVVYEIESRLKEWTDDQAPAGQKPDPAGQEKSK